MTAVSQSYPNYLGGLNEQPDELKKPGQLVEALNVIPDPPVGLSRRPGFQLITQSEVYENEADVYPDPEGTWFEIEYRNEANLDSIYFGNVRQDGKVVIYNQDGVRHAIRYTANNASVTPHKNYVYNNNILTIIDDNGDVVETVAVNAISETTDNTNGYFKHDKTKPLKYCVSKDHVIFTNPREVPTLSRGKVANFGDQHRYYSFINLKVIDTENYDYTFRVFGEGTDTYRYITDVEVDRINDILSDYDTDLNLPLHNQTINFVIQPQQQTGNPQAATLAVTFTGQVVQLKSSDGDGYRNEARYTWSTRIIDPGKGFRKGEVYKVTKAASDLNNGPTDLEFVFKINDVNTHTGVVNDVVSLSSSQNPPTNPTSREILEELVNQLKTQNIVTFDKVIIVGNGIYLETRPTYDDQTEQWSDPEPFSISTDEIAVADVMNSQKLVTLTTEVDGGGVSTVNQFITEEDDLVPIVRVNTVAELPIECYNGFVVEVINSFNNENNYYLQYRSESDISGVETANNYDFTKSDGYWEEIAKPFESNNPRDGTLPHMITIAKEADQDRFVFVVSPIAYKKRTAGTVLDNPSMFRDKSSITGINYYKNRLFFFTSSGTVVSSRAGEINNFFLSTAIDVSLTDPIDVVANSNQKVPIHGSAVVNNGMVLFGDTEQYMLTTNSDVLASSTVNVTKVSNYTYNNLSSPVSIGANIGFVSSGLSRFYEMTNLYDRGPVDINERSQQVRTTFGNGFNIAVSSREQSTILFYKYGAVDRNMMIYRFRQENSQESSQTAWVQWSVDQPIAYASLPTDTVYLFVKDPATENNQGCLIYKMDSNTTGGTVITDNSIPVIPSFTDGYTYDDDGNPTGGTAYETRIVFPTIYPRGNTSYDITANTTIHRIKLSTALIGTYELSIERDDGYDPYTLLVEQTPADDGGFVASGTIGEFTLIVPPLRGEHIETIPIYTRNKNLKITMSTEYDAPLTLRSMTWEGDWNPPYYKRV